ncbi:MAG TPA: hypothetical protein VMV48_12715 [Gallionellaceae bacterium]|nr:hypothetical protein [Gallionellaceae bacterium]
MNVNLPPVLLTSCIYIADHAVKLTDPTERINYTLESIEKWLSIAPGIRLIVCDSSGFDFAPAVKEKFSQADIECLFFVADKNLVQYHGKGYGEGEIIRYALQNSNHLKQSDFFAKCTAKLWVENFKECLDEWNGKFLCKGTFSNVFSLKKTCFDHIDTRFYLVSKDFYFKYLIDAHINLGGTTGMSIEDSFRNVILENRLKGVIFNTPPVIGGVGGGTGKYYNIKLTKKIKESLRSKIAKLNPSFRYLFNCS